MSAANAPFRDAGRVTALAQAIRREATRPWAIMEVCGGQTHAIVRHRLDALLPDGVRLIHGPGCPVCVTPQGMIDRAIEMAQRPDVMLLSFGDMLRVPGSAISLAEARGQGADVRIIYSPADAVRLAVENPEREVVLFAVGFETTAPTFAWVLQAARAQQIANLSMLCALVRVPPAMRAILDDPDCRVQGFLAAGHVCTVQGYREYEALAADYRVPIAVTGFEPVDIMAGIHACVRQLEAGRHEVENLYARMVQRDGNRSARAMVEAVFEPCDRAWRGLGPIADASLAIRDAYAAWDAEQRFAMDDTVRPECTACRSAEVMSGKLQPVDCPAFGRECTPEQPLGAPMVSSEGACAAYYQYRRRAA